MRPFQPRAWGRTWLAVGFARLVATDGPWEGNELTSQDPLAIHQGLIDRSSTEPGGEWRRGLPELSDGTVVLRELRSRDSSSLLVHLNAPRVVQHIAPCPSTVDGFQRFIRWTHAERRRGRHGCYGIIPPRETTPVGIMQIWPIERDWSTAEWGFVVGESHWGTGLFVRAAHLFMRAVFDSLGVVRLEARAVDVNSRGNGVLRKLGATREGVLRGGFRHGDVVNDYVMWSILAPEWLALRSRTSTAS
jgi:RimJ/RimL family protein N-acetyltransferase